MYIYIYIHIYTYIEMLGFDVLFNMGASKSAVFEVWLPSLGYKCPRETYAPMSVRGKSLRGSSRTFQSN